MAGDPVSRRIDSNSYEVEDGRLACLEGAGTEPDPLAVLVHSQFRGMMLSPTFPCLGGAGAVRRGDYRFGLYGPLGTAGAIQACGADLTRFVDEFETGENGVAVLAAAFEGPVLATEIEFETAMFLQLEGLHATDACTGDQPAIDLTDEDLGFLFAARNFFVVGFHPAASRWARRFAWPMLAFNALSHMEPLRDRDKFEHMKARIRARDLRLQGTENTALDLPAQAAQFSGRSVEDDWAPPGHFG